jgi:uncharacterized coiled-coil protein SlyX
VPSRTLVKPQDVLSTELVKLKQLQRQSVAPTGSQRNLTTEKVLKAIEDLKLVQAEQAELIEGLEAVTVAQAALLASLQAQINYQGTLRTFRATSDDDVFNNTPGGFVEAPETAPGLTFDLIEPMVVAITLRGIARIIASGPTSGFLNGTALIRYRLDGALSNAIGRSYGSQTVPSDGGNHGLAVDTLIEASDVVTLGAGSHTVTSYYSTQVNGASGSVRIEDQSVTVQILNRPS